MVFLRYLWRPNAASVMRLYFRLDSMSTKKRHDSDLFSFPVGNFQPQALPNPHPSAHLPRAQTRSRHALGSPQRLPPNRPPRHKVHLVPDPQRQKRQRHGVKVLGLHLGHFGALEAVLIRRFALDGDVATAWRAADEIGPGVLRKSVADLCGLQLVKRSQESHRFEPL